MQRTRWRGKVREQGREGREEVSGLFENVEALNRQNQHTCACGCVWMCVSYLFRRKDWKMVEDGKIELIEECVVEKPNEKCSLISAVFV
jgi:hypothetical protein